MFSEPALHIWFRQRGEYFADRLRHWASHNVALMEYPMKKSAITYVLAACGLAAALPQAAYALNAQQVVEKHCRQWSAGPL